MKSVKHAAEAGYFKAAIIFTLLTAAGLGVLTQTAAQTGAPSGYCEISLAGCPQDYDGLELIVPLDVIALSSRIQACGIADSAISDGNDAGAPAIMFIIDHSYSMWTGGPNNNGHDPNGNRYRATMALIDSVYARYRNAEVGIVVYNDALVFDAGRDSNLVEFQGPIYARHPNQSYLPLRPLSSMSVTGGSDPFYSKDTTWIGLLKNMVETVRTSGNRSVMQIKPPTIGGGYTDISLAFDAAVEALQSTNKPKNSQYIIFLSDGEPNVPDSTFQDNNPRKSREFDFITKVENVPTTYTVFLSAERNPGRPQTLHDMTENIQNSGYSSNNTSSAMWVMQSDYNAMLSLMMEHIIKPMFSRSEGDARTIVMTSGGATDSSTAANGSFTFGRQLPIDTSEVTTVEMGIRYEVRRDSVWTLEDGRDTSAIFLLASDSLFTYSFTIRRSSEPPDNWLSSQNLISNCGNRPRLDLQYNGASLIGGVIKGNMGVLTVRLDNTGGLFNYDDYARMSVEVRNALGETVDTEDYSLSKSGDAWTYDFTRLVDANAVPGNMILQHMPRDSVIVVFRNPHIPLDTLRISVPYVSTEMEFYDAPGDPLTGDPRPVQLPDTITVRAGDTTLIFAKFFDPNGNYDPSFESDPSLIIWQVSEPNLVTITPEGANGMFYSETAGRIHTLAATYQSAIQPSDRIVIHVLPADPHYIDIVFDAAAPANKVDPSRLGIPKPYEFENNADRATFYAFERDRFGNLVGPAEGAEWGSTSPAITASPADNGSSADIGRQGGGDGIVVTAEKPGLVTGRIEIRMIGESAVAIGPNPFVPGRDSPEERLLELDHRYGTNTRQYYKNILEGRLPNGQSTAINSNTGTLIAVTAPRSLQTNPNGTPKAAIIIYDATGNIVFRSKQNDIAMTDDRSTFGFVWDGRNNAGRLVGPGTYLVQMTGTQSDGLKFSSRRLLGVTLAK